MGANRSIPARLEYIHLIIKLKALPTLALAPAGVTRKAASTCQASQARKESISLPAMPAGF